MDKLKMQTPDLKEKNIDQIASLFPNVIIETRDDKGQIKRAIDFDLLKQLLSDHIIEGDRERYRLDWPGKKSSLIKANTPIRKTLRPCREESVNFDTTENLYIEGDNFEVLKILQESYLGKIKMIYIDPPYNTGKDFIYKDNYTQSKEDYDSESGVQNEEGEKLFRNTESNGRFHSDWLSMMYERLIVARDLLKDDGVIFISIDDNEVHNLRKICDEIFGEDSFVADIIWNSTKSVTNTALISVSHTHNLLYFKSIDFFIQNRTQFRLVDDGDGFKNLDNDPRGPWKADPFQVGGWRPNQQYDIKNPITGEVYKPNVGSSWKNDLKRFNELLKDNRIVFGVTGESGPQRKRFLYEAKERGKVSKTLWDDIDTTTNATQSLKRLFEGISFFDNPKPISLITRILELSTSQSSYVLDFFSGSATTAHAVMQFNAEDGGNRKFIMVQLAEKTDEDSEAYKAGYQTIAEIGKERIRRAGKKIVDELREKNDGKIDFDGTQVNPDELDIGFRVFKVDDSNMKDVYYHPYEMQQTTLEDLQSNIKDGRTPEDLLIQVMLDLGLELSLPIEKKKVLGNAVYYVQTNSLVACFDDEINFNIIDEIAIIKPLKVVFKDACFKDDKDRINVEERFKRLSPETIITVI
jgi:adenine-specific DNA-methyltransferase